MVADRLFFDGEAVMKLPKYTLYFLLFAVVGVQAWMWQKSNDSHSKPQSAMLVDEETAEGLDNQEDVEPYVFTLIDQHKTSRSSLEWRGKYVLLFFGFTHCPEVCPAGLAQITAALNMLDDADVKNIQPVFISVDVERDTPEQLASYMSNFHQSFVALTGTQADIDAVTQAFGIIVRQMKTDLGMMYNHTADALLLNPEGETIAYFPSNIGSSEMAVQLQEHLKQQP